MANVALNKYSDASNSMYPYRPALAVDGVLTPLNRWVGSSPLPVSGTPAPVWLRVDLGAPIWINRWVVKQMGTVGWSPNFNLTDYKLQGSLDNANWFDIDTVTNNSANSTDRPFAPRKARWVRAYVTKGLRCNTNFASIVDMEIYDAPNPPLLTGLTLQSGTTNVPITPPFSSQIYSYTAGVGSDIGSVTVTPTAAQGMVIKVNNVVVQSGQQSGTITLGSPSTLITVTVTSPDGTMTETYTITVSRGNASSFLSALVLTARGANMSPTFNKTTYDYTSPVTADNGTVTATSEAPGATIKVNNIVVPSGTPSGSITFSPGTTTIHIDVTASDGSSTHNYKIDVTR